MLVIHSKCIMIGYLSPVNHQNPHCIMMLDHDDHLNSPPPPVFSPRHRKIKGAVVTKCFYYCNSVSLLML